MANFIGNIDYVGDNIIRVKSNDANFYYYKKNCCGFTPKGGERVICFGTPVNGDTDEIHHVHLLIKPELAEGIFPKYYITNFSHIAYFKLDNVVSTGKWVHKNGAVEESTFTYYDINYRSDWQEITEQVALSRLEDKPRIRYFVGGCWCNWGIAYVAVDTIDHTKSHIVNIDGSSKLEDNDLKSCLRYVEDNIWQEVAEEKAKSLVKVKEVQFPRYFISGKDPWPTDAYVFVNDNIKDNGYVRKDGTADGRGQFNLRYCLNQVENGGYKEVSKEVAESFLHKFPKYYKTGYSSSHYLRVDNEVDNCTWINNTGEKLTSILYTYKDIKSFKDYIEVSKKEVEDFIKKVTKKFPRYFIGSEKNPVWAENYVYVEVNGDHPKNNWIVNKYGKKSDVYRSYSMEYCLEQVERGYFKEVSEKEAKALLVPGIRYFTSDLFKGTDIIYVECEKNNYDKWNAYTIAKTNTGIFNITTTFTILTYDACLAYVKAGLWKEITETEAFELSK